MPAGHWTQTDRGDQKCTKGSSSAAGVKRLTNRSFLSNTEDVECWVLIMSRAVLEQLH